MCIMFHRLRNSYTRMATNEETPHNFYQYLKIQIQFIQYTYLQIDPKLFGKMFYM
jgi:hypothetical protein